MQRAFGLNIPQTLEDVCDPTRLALVVYDMQVGIINQIKNGPEITGKVLQVLQGHARLEFGFSLPGTCHSPRNSWESPNCAWRWLGSG
jgi:hypothetical protein